MNNSTYARRTYSSSRPAAQTKTTPEHPAQSAVNGLIEQYEGKYEITAEFTQDHASMDLFKRESSVVIGFICTLYDANGKCLSQGRGLSFVGYQGDKYIQRGILYARNASLIDCAMRASKLSTIFVGDDKESDGQQREGGNYYLPPDVKPSDKQIKYLTGLIENLPIDEMNDILSRLPQMNKFDVSQLINKLKD
jgi:hypothetical protein